MLRDRIQAALSRKKPSVFSLFYPYIEKSKNNVVLQKKTEKPVTTLLRNTKKGVMRCHGVICSLVRSSRASFRFFSTMALACLLLAIRVSFSTRLFLL